MHPVHPMLVHAPITCWALTPVCDAAAVTLHSDFMWQAGALLAAIGVAAGMLAATAGALDYERAQKAAPKTVLIHASLMGVALVLATAGLFGRLDLAYHALRPPPLWAILASAAALVAMAVGAGFGGELVYGHGVHVRNQRER